jgi:hypothetical protein
VKGGGSAAGRGEITIGDELGETQPRASKC